ncbi:hypothetical protein AKJ16_DCAP25589 [Drosera capensis]
MRSCNTSAPKLFSTQSWPFTPSHESRTHNNHKTLNQWLLPHKQNLPILLHHLTVKCSASDGGVGVPGEDEPQPRENGSLSFWEKWKVKSAEMSRKLAKFGLAAVLAYGIFDGITYTSFFVMAFLGYEKSTGKNPAANIQALIGIVLLMWTGNNFTRPFRVAGAAALAPVIDKGLRKIQKALNLPSLVYAFAFVVSGVAMLCATVVGILVLSRWGK